MISNFQNVKFHIYVAKIDQNPEKCELAKINPWHIAFWRKKVLKLELFSITKYAFIGWECICNTFDESHSMQNTNFEL